jgi:hypothetical protein
MPRIRLDRSRYHSTVHGERTPDDPLAQVHYYQDGLPFDAAGHLVEDALDDEQKSRLVRTTNKQAPPPTDVAPADAGAHGHGAAESADVEDKADAPASAAAPVADEPVNLELWLTGEAKYLFDQVQAAIRQRYSKTVNTVVDAVEFLVLEQSLVDIGKVAKKLAPAFAHWR